MMSGPACGQRDTRRVPATGRPRRRPRGDRAGARAASGPCDGLITSPASSFVIQYVNSVPLRGSFGSTEAATETCPCGGSCGFDVCGWLAPHAHITASIQAFMAAPHCNRRTAREAVAARARAARAMGAHGRPRGRPPAREGEVREMVRAADGVGVALRAATMTRTLGKTMVETNPGTVLAGKYRVERVLGDGRHGRRRRRAARAARRARRDQVPRARALRDSTKRSSAFLREARAAVQIKSEHVARVLDVGTLESGAPYIVMEYLDGQRSRAAAAAPRARSPIADAASTTCSRPARRSPRRTRSASSIAISSRRTCSSRRAATDATRQGARLRHLEVVSTERCASIRR